MLSMPKYNSSGFYLNKQKYSMFSFFFNEIGSRSCSIFMGSTTNHETSISYAILSCSLLVHFILSSKYHFNNCCSTTSFRVIHFPFQLSLSLYIYIYVCRFTNDPNTFNIDKQFLVGSAILVSPNLFSVNYSYFKECNSIFIFIHRMSVQ